MKHSVLTVILMMVCLAVQAEDYSFGNGKLRIRKIAANAVRIQYSEGKEAEALPEWLYVEDKDVVSDLIQVGVNREKRQIEVKDKAGNIVFVATDHQLRPVKVSEREAFEAQLTFRPGNGADEEFQYGLGQFQDGQSNVRGLSRRLTQVNTQISIPMLISSKGYGVLWNNYGLTDFNPCDKQVALVKDQGNGKREVVDVTSTEGGKREVREQNRFSATIEIAEEGDYSLLLDVGQKMARRHNLVVDGKTVIDMRNLWLPPTASEIIHLSAGSHTLSAELTNGDKPVLYYKKVDNNTVFRSPVAQVVDYTVFVGTPDEIIASFRHLTGEAPMMPKWALGYIHCRERFHSSDEILKTAGRFRNEGLPIDVIVQDWQYWGKYGWNSMQFDEQYYPDPKALTDSLHKMNMHLMVSVWSKIDKNSEVGKMMGRDGHYIPGTDWIDFFNPQSAEAYWRNFSQRLVPLGIDAWWQDATEPENDDLQGRRVWNGKYPGELFRNVYPLLVNKTVYEGLRQDQPNTRSMILTRCGFPGIQRYGSAMWSGDVGNDWETFRRQITAGLGMQAAGIPWWTYDAGGFFRPGNQYNDQDYIERLLRWIQTSVFLPLMRVHGYMSNTEPWNYGDKAKGIIANSLKLRYQLMPYIYSSAAEVSFNGSTIMRPLVFDFANDKESLKQKYEYMFGRSLLVSPITESGVKTWQTYLPPTNGGWYDLYTSQLYQGGKTVSVAIDETRIPVFVRAGSILPYGPVSQYATEENNGTLEVRIYPGADATFTLYEDDGYSTDYQQGKYSRITFTWDDSNNQLVIGSREGKYKGNTAKRMLKVSVIGKKDKTIKYTGHRMKLKM